MKTLYIDTHFLDVNIVLYKDGNVFLKKEICNVKNNSEFIMPLINETCKPEEIDEIIVVNGPGSFTGIRLGVTIAKTLAFTLNKPIKVLSFFDVLYASNNFNDGIYAISDNNGFYINEYSNGISLNNYNYLSNKEYEVFSLNNNIFNNIDINYKNVYLLSQKKESINPHLVNPIYIKLIGAQK